jgi:hypothetical protein
MQDVIVANRKGGKDQRWKIVYTDAAKDMKKEGMIDAFGFIANEPFYLRSRLPMRRIAAIRNDNFVHLVRAVKGTNNQQVHYFDPVSKTIRNKWRSNIALAIMASGTKSDG